MNAAEKIIQNAKSNISVLLMVSAGNIANRVDPFPKITESHDRMKNLSNMLNPNPSHAQPNSDMGTATQPFRRTDTQMYRLPTHNIHINTTKNHVA